MKKNHKDQAFDDMLDSNDATQENLNAFEAGDMPLEGDIDSYETQDETLGVIGLQDDAAAEQDGAKSGMGAKHAKPDQPEYMRKSRKMRKILIAIIVVLIALIVAGVVLGYQLFQTANIAATQQTQSQSSLDAFTDEGATKDASTTTAKTTTVPNLVSLLGLNVDQAIEVIQHGAQVTSSIEVNEEGNPIRMEVRLGLTAEPSDSKNSTPTVYLSLDENGAIIQSGYSVGTSSLGYGSLSYSDAIVNEHLIEETLSEAGLTVENGSVVLPEDKMAYSSYASDGTTLTRESCSFEGVGTTADGASLPWNAILSYDYTTANATGNLADTIRTVYVYVAAFDM